MTGKQYFLVVDNIATSTYCMNTKTVSPLFAIYFAYGITSLKRCCNTCLNCAHMSCPMLFLSCYIYKRFLSPIMCRNQICLGFNFFISFRCFGVNMQLIFSVYRRAIACNSRSRKLKSPMVRSTATAAVGH